MINFMQINVIILMKWKKFLKKYKLPKLTEEEITQ